MFCRVRQWRNVLLSWQARAGGVSGVRTHPPPLPPKRSAWWERKRIKMTQNNVVMLGLTISMHFQQFEDLDIHIFSEGACPWTPPKSLQSVQSWAGTRVPQIWKISSHKPTSREIYIFITFHIICYKMKKPLNWISRWIPRCSRDEWRMNYKIKSHNKVGLFDRRAF